MNAREITVDDATKLIAQTTPASAETVAKVAAAPLGVEGDGRSEFKWMLLASGELALVVFPQGPLYEEIVQMLAAEGNPLVGP